MDGLELSIISEHPGDLLALQRMDLGCEIVLMSWDAAWADLMRAAIYKHGPDVSQVGAPWVSNFVAMNALRPFDAGEIATMGGSEVFLPAAWQTVLVAGSTQGWAMPWLADVRVIYYWRDMLERAGVDERLAFETHARLEDTLGRLKARGVAAAWIVTTQLPFSTLQNVASWVWGAGGDFVSVDGKQPMFDQAEALAGIRDYFSLHRYLPPGIEQLDVVQMIDLFGERKAAVAMGTPNWLTMFRDRYREAPDIIERLGVALPPGPPYVGGSNLVVWEYARREREALELIRRLTSKKVQVEYCQQIGYLPVRLDALAEPPYSSDPSYQVLVEALKAGRTYPSLQLWGLVEERLSGAFIKIWADILGNPDQDLDAVIAGRLDPLARRLALTLRGAG